MARQPHTVATHGQTATARTPHYWHLGRTAARYDELCTRRRPTGRYRYPGSPCVPRPAEISDWMVRRLGPGDILMIEDFTWRSRPTARAKWVVGGGTDLCAAWHRST